MKDKKAISEFYDKLDKSFYKTTELLNRYPKSQVLQNYFFNKFKTLIYANLINIFFNNLKSQIIKELKLPKGKNNAIKKEYSTVRKTVKSALSHSKSDEIDENYYSMFKSSLAEKFPDFSKIMLEIEKKVQIENLPVYLAKKKTVIEQTGKDNSKLTTSFITFAIEEYVRKHNDLPNETRFRKSLKSITKESLEELSQRTMETLKQDSSRMLKERRKNQKGFENRLYQRWKEPLDLLESLIVICFESGQDKKDRLSKGRDITSPKQAALIKIHARSVQISYEILALLKAGFADGAYARWRSLHELSTITFFLKDNSDDVSRRYLEHELMRKFKEAKDYQKHHKEIGYPKLTRTEFSRIKKEHDKLLKQYGAEFEYRNGFEWIPRTILPNPNFTALENHVKLDKWRPFYNMSADSVHGGSKGFFRLGLTEDSQDKILLVGPTDYGHADPIHSTAISLSHVTLNLLLLEPSFEDLLISQVILRYVKEIGQKALSIQKRIEKEHRSTKF